MEQLLKPTGEVIAEHRANYAWRIVCTVLFGAPAAMMLAAAWTAPRDTIATFMVPAAVPIALVVFIFFQQAKVRVVLRSDGIERWGLRGELWSLRWEDAPHLCYQARRARLASLDAMILLAIFPALGKSIRITLIDANGHRRKLPDSLKAMDLLAERVTEQHTAAQFPVLRAALERGEEVRFGRSLSLDREQIVVKKLFGGVKRCLLSDVEKVNIADGQLKIRQRGKTFAFARFRVARLPNAFLFVKLFDSTRPSNVATPRPPRPALRNVG